VATLSLELAYLPDLTLDGALHRQATIRPDAPALLGRHRSFTYAELEEAVAVVAGALREAGLTPGGRLVAFPQRTWELPLLFLATARAGGVFTPLDAAVGDRLDPVLEPGFDLAWAPENSDRAWQRLAVHGARSLPGLDELLTSGACRLGPSQDPSVVCYLNFTVGPTGVPEGVPTSHAQVQWNTRGCLETFRWQPDERYLCLFAPFAHPHEHWARPLATGGVCVMCDTVRPRTVFRVIEACEVSWLFAVPSLVELLQAAAPETPPASLRMVETGGALVTPDLVRRAEAALDCQVMPIWGSTETTGVALHVPPWEPDRRLDGLGRALRHYQVQVHDPDPVSRVGELVVGGAAVGTRYEGSSAEHRFRDGRVHTGDLVCCGPERTFRFVGRQEAVIKVGGLKVFLTEVEEALRGHPEVVDAVVVPAPDRLRGEVPRAIVVPVAGSELSVETLTGWCRVRLRPEQVPRRMELWETLPRTAVGTVDRSALGCRCGGTPTALAPGLDPRRRA